VAEYGDVKSEASPMLEVQGWVRYIVRLLKSTRGSDDEKSKCRAGIIFVLYGIVFRRQFYSQWHDKK
jgi:hypothetical protein